MDTQQWFQSSTGSGDLSLTLKGLLVFVLPLAHYYLRSKGLDFGDESVGALIDALLAFIAAGMSVIGLLRKGWVRLSTLSARR